MYFTHPQFKNFLLNPFLKGFSEIELRNKLAKIFPNYNIILTDSGRSAFQLAIRSLNLQNSEMLFPAYICDIFKPILEKYNIKPIYLDADLKTFHISISEVEKKITPQIKSILICHTYGLPVEMDKILEIAKKYNLKIIEDCAHIFPSKIYGDCAFFSFAKLFPVVNGGMLISKYPIKINLLKYKSKLSNLIKFLRLFPFWANLSEKFRKSYEKPPQLTIPRKASKLSLKTFDWYLNQNATEKRKKLAEYFHKKLREIGFQSSGITYISALIPENINRDELFNKLRKRGIFCSRIWQNPLFKELPNTLETSERIINFPLQNWFTSRNIDIIIKEIKINLK